MGQEELKDRARAAKERLEGDEEASSASSSQVSVSNFAWMEYRFKAIGKSIISVFCGQIRLLAYGDLEWRAYVGDKTTNNLGVI